MMAPLFSSILLLVLFFGTLFGLILGVLPGLGPTTGGALILPFTMTLDPLSAIVLLTSIYCAGTYGGAITAILINTPGTPAAAATCLDGYPLAQKGEAGRALGMATVSSTVGGIFSVIILVFFAPLLAKLAYEFGQPEYFALAIFGLTRLASIGEGSPIKNLIAGAFGILISTIGKDFMTSIDRFTYGINELSEGIGFIPVVVGLFAISEMLTQSTLLDQVFKRVALKAVKLPSLNDYKLTWKTILRSSGIGSFIGVLPAEGGTVASLIGYSEAKRFSNDDVFVIEANPRASRTTPFIAKAYKEPFLKIATHVMIGSKKIKDFNIKKQMEGYAIKVPVFSFNKFPNVDKQLGPEMKSTGEAIRFIKDLKDPFFRKLDKERSMYLSR